MSAITVRVKAVTGRGKVKGMAKAQTTESVFPDTKWRALGTAFVLFSRMAKSSYNRVAVSNFLRQLALSGRLGAISMAVR